MLSVLLLLPLLPLLLLLRGASFVPNRDCARRERERESERTAGCRAQVHRLTLSPEAAGAAGVPASCCARSWLCAGERWTMADIFDLE